MCSQFQRVGNECGGKNENEGSKVGIRFFGFIFGKLESLMYQYQLSCAFPAATFDVWKAK